MRLRNAEKHTPDFVKKLLGSFRGFLQSDASNVDDMLERGPPSEDDETVTLVGCPRRGRCRELTLESTGGFFHANGERLPW